MPPNGFTPTPWRDKNELLTIRGWFYYIKWVPVPDNRRKACSIVKAWKFKGDLPHAVEATMLLTQAVLADTTDVDVDVIRLIYTGAFCR